MKKKFALFLIGGAIASVWIGLAMPSRHTSAGVRILEVAGGLAVLTGIVAMAWEAAATPQTERFAKSRQQPTSRQLRQDMNAKFIRTRGFLFARRYHFTATSLAPTKISAAAYDSLVEAARVQPMQVARSDHRTWWRYGDAYYWENVGYSADDVLALLRDRERTYQRKLDRAHMMLTAEAAPRVQQRDPITREMRRAVWDRDGGRCQECGSTFDLQYDHVIPVAMGGATSLQNLQLLCSACNQSKGASI